LNPESQPASAWDNPAPEAPARPRVNVAGLSKTQLVELLPGVPAYRAAQIFEGLYKHRWTTWDSFTSLSKALRERLQVEVELAWPEIVESVSSEDGSTKHAFRLADGKLVEGVHMPYAGRTTLCLSSQVGCAMGCTFCATGQMGIVRNLTAGEIVGQVVAMLNKHDHAEGLPVNLVFMGMGEPMHNLDHVMAACALLTDPAGQAIPPRRITMSTCGLVTGIEKLARFRKRPRLAISLNGTTDRYRSQIMPVNRVWNLLALSNALRAFPVEKGEHITLEYVLLKGITDSMDDARRLVAFARQFPSKINLIPFNAHEGSGFHEPAEDRIEEFCKFITGKGLTVSVRRSRGQDVAGACGQLVREGRKKT